MKKITLLAVVVFMLAGVASAYAGSGSDCSTTKSSGQSQWTKIYNDISNWSWSK